MIKHYLDYAWKGGIPYGIEPVDPLSTESYKIIIDPYRKRISIEKYSNNRFTEIIYDSALFDFRHLKSPENASWQKIVIKETDEVVECFIRNQDDRILFFESYSFEQGLCRECTARSVHGYPISRQRMFYKAFRDPFNGVVLFDSNNHPVMYKHYEVDETGEFSLLLKEEWHPDSKNFISLPVPLPFPKL